MVCKDGRPAAKRMRLDYGDDMVTIVAGTGAAEKNFKIHKSVLGNHSTFLRAAIFGNFKEAEEKVIKLPESDPKVFAFYVQWIYSGEVMVSSEEELAKDDHQDEHRERLASFYILGDALGDTLLRNKITDRYRRSVKESCHGPSVATVVKLYELTPDSSKLRELVLDWFLAERVDEWLATYRDRLPHTFFADLAINWASTKSKFEDPIDSHRCKYHEHNQEVPTCK